MTNTQPTDSSSSSTARFAATAVALVVGMAVLAAVAVFVATTDAGIEYDDAVYLTRGLFHAEQAQAKGDLVLPRLAWSLGFEAPKPPLFQGLLALAVLAFGKDHVTAVLLVGTLLPLMAVGAAIYGVGRVTAAGHGAAILALALYLAMPAALGLGTRLLTETTLAAAVVGGSLFALRRVQGGRRRLGDEIAVGVCAGLSLLAKLLGPLFLAPVMGVALVECWRREGARPALRFAAVSSLAAGVVALPWYLRNWQEAWDFALFARTQASCLYPFPAWMRPVDFIRGTVGWPMVLLLVCLAVWRPAGAVGPAALLRRMAIAAAAVSAAVIGIQPMFDPRFWLPAAALLAAWMGVELRAAWKTWSSAARSLATAGVVVLLAVPLVALVTEPRPRMPWQASRLLASLGAGYSRPPLMCILGNNPDWNVEKLRLAIELSGVRPRPVAADLLVDGKAVDFSGKLAQCNVVFALRPDQIPSIPNQLRLNTDLALARRELDARRGLFAPDRSAAAALGSRTEVEVFTRVSQRASR